MEPLPHETLIARPSIQTAVRGGASLPTAPYVAVVFKERHYEDGAPKIWYFAKIDRVTIANGRLQLTRDGYGLVCDIPYEEVEQVYAEDQGTSAHTAWA